MPQEKSREKFIAGLRQLADFLEQHPEVPEPNCQAMTAMIWQDDAKAALRKAALALGSTEKKFSDSYVFLSRNFGSLNYQVMAFRNAVCRRLVVGLREVPEQVIPAHQQEIVEWECDPILAGEAPSESPADQPSSPAESPVSPAGSDSL